MRASSRSPVVLVVLAALGLTAGGLIACGGGEETGSTGTPVADPAVVDPAVVDPAVVDPAVDEAPPPAPEARATWTEDTFELAGTATGPFVVGTASSFEIRLTPLGEYHVNRNYPWSVTVTPPAAVTVPTTTYDAATATEMTDTVARFVVPFTPTAAGPHDVTTSVDFGICREEACVFEMRNVLVHVEVVDGAAAGAAPAGAPAAPAAEGTTTGAVDLGLTGGGLS